MPTAPTAPAGRNVSSSEPLVTEYNVAGLPATLTVAIGVSVNAGRMLPSDVSQARPGGVRRASRTAASVPMTASTNWPSAPYGVVSFSKPRPDVHTDAVTLIDVR
jgi:hypothetical protein